MRGAHAARAVLLTTVFCLAGSWAAAGPAKGVAGLTSGATAMLAERGDAKMPGGFASLCAREPSFCKPAAAAAHELALTPEQLRLLVSVNAGVNRRIASTTDQALYGKVEFWTLPGTAGDCEDYVLLKRQMLNAAGLPLSLLLITVVHDENGEGHAVLTVPADGGDVVLDNRRDDILRWQETGYVFVKRQSAADPRRWVSLGHDALQATNIASAPEAP